jgi:ribonuclease HI
MEADIKSLWRGKMRDYLAWFDGSCGPVNPGGTATSGAIVKDKEGNVLLEELHLVGKGEGMSNNVAEYAAVIRVFDFISFRRAAGYLTVHGDSLLVINQLNGKWRVREGLYRVVALKAQRVLGLLRSMGWEIHFVWIPREQNEECDALSKRPLADEGVLPEFQPLGIPTELWVDPMSRGTALLPSVVP